MTGDVKTKGAALPNVKTGEFGGGNGAAGTKEDAASRTPRSARRGGSGATPFEAAMELEEQAGAGLAGRELLSDEEMAWRLHQELNAWSPVLRTRSRKHPDPAVPAAPANSKDAAAVPAKGAAIDKAAGGKRSTTELSPASSEQQQQQMKEKGKGKGEQQAPASAPKRGMKQQKGGKAAKVTAAAPAGEAAEPAAGEDKPASESDAAQAVAAAAVAAVLKAVDEQHAEDSAQQQNPARGAAVADSMPGVSASQQLPATAAAAAGPKPGMGKQAAAASGKAAYKDKPAGKPAAGDKVADKSTAADKAAGKAPAGAKVAKLLKIPRLPMVRHSRKWYRCRVLKDDGDKVLMEFSGMKAAIPSAWVPRYSNRIWRGSYKGKDWKYLGDGAWAPKGKGSSGGKKAKSGSKPRSTSTSTSCSRDGSSAAGSEEEKEEEEDEDMEGGDETAQSLEQQHAAVMATAAGRKRSAGDAGLAHSHAMPVAAAAVQDDVEAEVPVKKKIRDRNGRKRLDPIVREAMRAVEHAQEESEAGEEAAAWPTAAAPAAPTPAAPAPAPAPASTPVAPAPAAAAAAEPVAGPSMLPSMAVTPERVSAAGAKQQQGQTMGQVLNHTPTPETPLTKLATRTSTPPGMQPLSPGAAAAALLPSPHALAAAAAAGASQAEPPSSPQAGIAKRADGAVAAAAATMNSPLSPRSSKRGAAAAAFDPPVSPRARAQAKPRGGSSGEEDEAAVHEAQAARGGRGGARRSRRQAASEATTSSDSGAEVGEESDSSGAASDSAEDKVRQRPRRTARKAALFNQAEYAFDEEAPLVLPVAPAAGPYVATSMEALAAFAQPVAPSGPPAPARRRRKPVVSKAAPTDVALPDSEPLPVPMALPIDPNAYLAFLEQLSPASPHAAATGRVRNLPVAPQRAAAAAAQDSEDADEDYVPPSSARDHGHHPERYEKHEKHGRQSHHHHHQRGGGGASGLNGRRRSIQGALGVASGRMHKHEHTGAVQRHHYNYHHFEEEEEGEDGLGELPVAATRARGGAIGRSQSAAADLQHPVGHCDGNGRPLNGAHHRSFSSPAWPSGASLGGLLTATKLFAPILGALGGPAGAAHPATAAMAATGTGTSSGGGSGLQTSPSKRHLFSSTWSGGSSSSTLNPASLNGYSNNSSARLSLLALKDELFASATFNGSNGVYNSSQALPSSACAPMPLFC